MGVAAKVLAGIGATLLLASGACFLFLDDVLGGAMSAPNAPWVIGVVLIVGGVLALVAAFGLTREPR